MLGSAGACATAWAAARLPAAAAAPRARNLRRSMGVLLLCCCCGKTSLTLDPGQARLAPAADAVAMLLGVLVALEALQDVVGLAPAGAHRRLGRSVRARPRAAQEHDRL